MYRVEIVFNDDTTRIIERVEGVKNLGDTVVVYTEVSDILIPARNFKSLETEEVAGEGRIQ